jgi:hypothetical protein
MRTPRLLIYCVLALACPLVSYAQGKPALVVLGSAHFSNPGRDNVNYQVEDVLSDRRQREIEVVVKELAAFHPTRIAVVGRRKRSGGIGQTLSGLS